MSLNNRISQSYNNNSGFCFECFLVEIIAGAQIASVSFKPHKEVEVG